MATFKQLLESLNLSEEKPKNAGPGDTWQTKSGNWVGMKQGKKGEKNPTQSYGQEGKKKAKAYATGGDPDKVDDSGQDEEEPKPEKELEKKPKTKQATSKTEPNVAGGSPALVLFKGTDPESVEGINDFQSDLENQRAQGIAGAGGQKASQGESVYCGTLNSLDNDKFKEENSTAIEEKKKTLKIMAQDKEDLEALGLDPDSDEGKDYLATREVFADQELEKIKSSPPHDPKAKPPSNNVFFMKNGFGGKEEAYKEWMRTAYDGALATRKVLKEDTGLDVSKPHTTLQSTGDIDDKVAADLEAKVKAAKTDEDKAYYTQELKDFQHFRQYHDTYTVGVDTNNPPRTHIVSISNKKGSNLKDPQNNTTPAKRFNVIKDDFGEEVAKTVTNSLNTNIKKVRETKMNASRGGTEVEIDDELISGISALDDKYKKDIDKPGRDIKTWLKKTGKKYPSGEWPENAKEKLELRNEYVKEQQGQFDEANDRLYKAIDDGAKPTDKPSPTYTDADGEEKLVFKRRGKKDRDADVPPNSGPEFEDTPNTESVTYNSFGRLFTKLGEEAKKGDAPKEGGSLEKCIGLKRDEQDAVSQAHQQVIKDIYTADNPKGDGKRPEPGEDNGPHAQGYVNTVMDAMHFNSYIDGGDGKMVVQMGIRAGQPSQIRGCLAELSGYEGDSEDKDALKNHMKKRCRIDEKNGNILIQDNTGEKVLAEDTFRTAGTGQKVASGFGSSMRDCVIGKIDEKRASKKVSEQNQYESLEGTISRMAQ